MRGPIDYIIVGFEGNQFTGEIIQELEKATNDGTIAVLGLSLITPDANGEVNAVEIADTGALNILGGGDLVSEDDIQEVGELLEDNSSAGLLVIEQLWAKGLKQAIINANGTLLSEGRIHPEASAELSKEG